MSNYRRVYQNKSNSLEWPSGYHQVSLVDSSPSTEMALKLSETASTRIVASHLAKAWHRSLRNTAWWPYWVRSSQLLWLCPPVVHHWLTPWQLIWDIDPWSWCLWPLLMRANWTNPPVLGEPPPSHQRASANQWHQWNWATRNCHWATFQHTRTEWTRKGKHIWVEGKHTCAVQKISKVWIGSRNKIHEKKRISYCGWKKSRSWQMVYHGLSHYNSNY